jgi:MraZ protein
MAFFKGQELFSIDIKGRVAVPSKMRKSISPEALDTFVVTRGFEKCIFAYPLDEWKTYEDKYQKLSQYDEQSRFFLRKMLMWSEEVKLDPQQRISLPKKMLEFAGIETKVLIVGMIDHVELWNPEEFEKYIESHEESYEEVAAKVMNVE